ncbi:hypothetical protein ACQ4LE_001760 [Meloidogyne hapla]
MKIAGSIIFVFINSIVWKLTTQVSEIEKKRNAYIKENGKTDLVRTFYPGEDMQITLIDLYKGENPKFREAYDNYFSNKKSMHRKPILDKVDRHLWVDFIRGILLLVVYGEVSYKAHKIDPIFVKVVLATQGLMD